MIIQLVFSKLMADQELFRVQYDLKTLLERKRIWKRKTIIRNLYNKWYKMIRKATGSGKTLEVGGGSGNLKEYFPDVINSDIVLTPWLDTVLDAHYLPFKDNSLGNIILIDVLHHMATPVEFFFEAKRVLKPEGRVIMIEPYISWNSFFVYKYLHHEEMIWDANPLRPEGLSAGDISFEGNQAVPTLLFEKYRAEFLKMVPFFQINDIQRIDYFAYPLSGGFHNPSLCPLFIYPILEYIEKRLKFLSHILAFRLFVVIQKIEI